MPPYQSWQLLHISHVHARRLKTRLPQRRRRAKVTKCISGISTLTHCIHDSGLDWIRRISSTSHDMTCISMLLSTIFQRRSDVPLLDWYDPFTNRRLHRNAKKRSSITHFRVAQCLQQAPQTVEDRVAFLEPHGMHQPWREWKEFNGYNPWCMYKISGHTGKRGRPVLLACMIVQVWILEQYCSRRVSAMPDFKLSFRGHDLISNEVFPIPCRSSQDEAAEQHRVKRSWCSLTIHLCYMIVLALHVIT